MGAWIKYHGTINVDPTREGFEAALKSLQETFYEADSVEFETEGEQVHVSFGNTASYSHMESIDEALSEFAARFATEPARIFTQYEDEAEEVCYVGPEGFDELAMMIEDTEAEVKDAQDRLAALIKRRAERDGAEQQLAAEELRQRQEAYGTSDGEPMLFGDFP